MRVLQEIYGDAASDIESAPTTGHMGPGGQLGQAALRDYHSYGHAAAGRLAIARSLAEAMSRRGEGVNLNPEAQNGQNCRSGETCSFVCLRGGHIFIQTLYRIPYRLPAPKAEPLLSKQALQLTH